MYIYILLFLIGKIRHGIGKKVAIFDWEWGRNSTPRDGQKIPWGGGWVVGGGGVLTTFYSSLI